MPLAVVAVGLVQHRVQRRLGVPGLDADHGQALVGKRREQPRTVRERFQPDALQLDTPFRQEQFDRVRIGLEFRLPDHLAVAVHHANVGRLERHIKPCIEVHHAPPPPPTAGPHRAFRSRIAVQHFRSRRAGEGAPVSTPANQKSFGFLLTDRTERRIGLDWRARAASRACLHQPHTYFAERKAHGSQLQHQGAAA
ncbi:hypothetical protein ACVWXQ_000314 [Bradyrhizobium sp. S3.14.4]